MAWALLTTDYKDAVWSGLKRYSMVENSDGTVSFQDVTVYTNKEKSFFGAKDANRMNEALNYIMSMLESGTDLYEEFQTYFATQQTLFRQSANGVVENVRTLCNAEYDSFRNYLNGLKSECDTSIATIERNYEAHMTTYEGQQNASFTAWFNGVKGQLSTDVAGNLQNQITEVEERLRHMERMALNNLFTAPVAVNADNELLVDDLGFAIVADWKYEEV